MVISKPKERALLSDSLEVFICAVKNNEEEMNEGTEYTSFRRKLIYPLLLRRTTDWKREQAITIQAIQKDGDLNFEKSFNKAFNELNPKWGVKIEKNKVDLSNRSSKLIISCIVRKRLLFQNNAF